MFSHEKFQINWTFTTYFLSGVSKNTATCAYNNNQSNVQETMGRSKILRRRTKGKTTTQTIAKLFEEQTKAKKYFPISLFIDLLLKITNKQLIILGKITVSLKPWTLLQINVTWDSKTFIRAPIIENLCVELEKL